MTKYNFNTIEELREFMDKDVIGTIEAAEILECSRQNIKRLVDNGKLVPLKELERDRIFLKQDILNRKTEMDLKKASK